MKAVSYLRARGIDDKTAIKFGIGYANPYWKSLSAVFSKYSEVLIREAGLVVYKAGDNGIQSFDLFRNRIMFPIRSRGGLIVGFTGRTLDDSAPKYLNSPESSHFKKGELIYGFHESIESIQSKDMAIVVEGTMDVLSLHQAGIDVAVATMGTACTSDHIAELLAVCNKIVFCFDGDAAGCKAALRAMEVVLPFAFDSFDFRFVFLPLNEDPDSFVRAEGISAFNAAVECGLTLSQFMFQVIKDGCDLTTAEGGARALSRLRKHWSKLPEGRVFAEVLSAMQKATGLTHDELINVL